MTTHMPRTSTWRGPGQAQSLAAGVRTRIVMPLSTVTSTVDQFATDGVATPYDGRRLTVTAVEQAIRFTYQLRVVVPAGQAPLVSVAALQPGTLLGLQLGTGQLKAASPADGTPQIGLYVEVSVGTESLPTPPAEPTKDPIWGDNRSAAVGAETPRLTCQGWHTTRAETLANGLTLWVTPTAACTVTLQGVGLIQDS